MSKAKKIGIYETNLLIEGHVGETWTHGHFKKEGLISGVKPMPSMIHK
jgi:hypothetical protein